MKHLSITALTISITLMLTACGHHKDIDKGQYWQRTTASDMAYITGPKAQQMLNRDISRCVTELRELERLGQIKDPIPVEYGGRRSNNDRALMKNDVTDRDGYLLAEHNNYTDFETCMASNGWDRTRSVPYDVADRAKKNYLAVLSDGVKGLFKDEDDDKQLNGGYNDYEVND
ncbi:hypothetical protein N9Z27_02200 [Alphaproteobacteria bacterium]|nr:hypothetical protein [Alphaproteobacteria bacterium]